MAEQNKKKLNPGWFLLLIALPLTDLVLTIRYILHGKNVAIFNPKGLIAQEQHNVMVLTLTVLVAIALPTLLILFFFAWKYRDTNLKSNHTPNGRRGRTFDLTIWLIPTLVMLLLVSIMWTSTHNLVPQKAIVSDTKPLTIQVISLRWKWLFLYPEQKIATVNLVQLPINTPVTFEMTADETPMSSFWIPNLGGQLYTMTSHVNRLNLMATTIGEYPGSSAEINGAGFAGMKFTARAGSSADFEAWVKSVQQSPDVLDTAAYTNLLNPSQYNPAASYSTFNPNLFASVISKYQGPGGHHH